MIQSIIFNAHCDLCKDFFPCIFSYICELFFRSFNRLSRQLKDKEWSIIDFTRTKVDAFRRTIPLLGDLKNPCMRERHWDRIRTLMNRFIFLNLLIEYRVVWVIEYIGFNFYLQWFWSEFPRLQTRSNHKIEFPSLLWRDIRNFHCGHNGTEHWDWPETNNRCLGKHYVWDGIPQR